MKKLEQQKITVLIPTYNVENIIRRCIQSVSWADEVFVVDSFSKDKTVKIAKEMGARIIQHKYEYSAKQKNWAIPKAENEWILLLDSDEVVSEELGKEIESILKTEDLQKYKGFAIPRKHYFLDKWLKWGGRYPLYNIRLFKRDCRYEDRDVHAHIILQRKNVKKLQGDILHYSDLDLTHYFEKFNRYTTYQANYMIKVDNGKAGVKFSLKKFVSNFIYTKSYIKDFWYRLPLVSLFRFIYMYVIRLGFMDGRYGFLIATLYSFEDYVSKTKYLELKFKNPKFRYLTQRFVMKSVVFSAGLETSNRKDGLLEIKRFNKKNII